MQLLVYTSDLPGWSNWYLFVSPDFSEGCTGRHFPHALSEGGIPWSTFIRDRKFNYLFTCSSQSDFDHQLVTNFPELLL